MKKTLFIIFLVAVIQQSGFAQQDPQGSMYFFNPLAFNPAYAGSRGSANVTAIGRFQWVGINGAPNTQFLSVHMPFKSQSIGVGLHVINDKIGSRTSQSIYADFAFAVRLNKKEDRLSFGLTGGVDINQFNFNGLVVTDPTDINYLNTYNGANPNFGLGVYYYGKRHYLGFSIPRLLSMSLSNSTVSTASTSRHYYLAAGYVFKLSSVVDFKPSVLLKITENAPFTLDVNASFFLFERFWVGGMYRFHESAGLNIAYQVKDFMLIGYSFDYPINDLRTNNFGSHEVVLSFDLMKKKRSVVGPRYF
jgi:type IX secretion system PorP/SprF family membrane protein